MKITLKGKKNAEQKLSKLHEKHVILEKEKALAYTSTGDTWHDNPYFDILRREEEALVKEIEALNDFLLESEVIENSEEVNKIVNIGSRINCRITYSFEDEPEEKIIEIVGHGESEDGKVAYDSPVGENLLGHVEGETVTFAIPAGEVSYKILSFL